MPQQIDTQERCRLARRSLDGLSLGDAFGQRFFLPRALAHGQIAARTLPAGTWFVTDDTIMGISVVENLEAHGEIDQDSLAEAFARRYGYDPSRGYGGTAHRILRNIGAGRDWRRVTHEVFDGMGSMGNGGAMRAAPIGAYFHDAPAVAAEQAQAASAVTHGHPEGVAGGAAVAVAAAHAYTGPEDPRELLTIAADHTPDTLTRAGIVKARRLPLSTSIETAAHALGSGKRLLSQDTVPFALWCAARHLSAFEDAMWATVAGLGDRDTTCAIVGSIVALHPANASLPAAWLQCRESLDGATLAMTGV